MRKLSIIFFLVFSMNPAMTYAVNVCGVEVRIPKHIAKPVTCSNCRTFTDFGMYGGAILSGLSLTSIRVRNDNGVDAEVSIQRYVPHPTGANISADFLRWLGIKIDLSDPHRSAVTVDTINGYIFGARWDGRRTLDRSLEAKCEQIKLEKEAKEKADKTNVRDLEPSAARYRNSINRWELAANRWLSIYDGTSRVIPIVRQIELERESTITTREVANWSKVPNKGTGAVGTRKKEH